ncbi:MAG: molybdenum cofactor guanylyltransferase [Desulfovibrionales bacterium]|nr:molybdenum cofactor guanylyltransferase [Desulfovibrionales bacterium]
MRGVVLAGGQSSRLGQDKTAVLHGGQTLLERSAALLGRHCEEVYISCRHPETMPLPLPVIVDVTERMGPVGGIITALRRLGGPLLVLACDLPFMEDSVVRQLLQAHAKRPPHCVMTTWEQGGTGFIEALVAIYEDGALPHLEQGVARGVFKLSRLIPPSLRHTITYAENDGKFFFNVNYPHDLRKLDNSEVHVL